MDFKHLKPGDRVLICDEDTMNDLFTPCVIVDEMFAFCNQVVTISDIPYVGLQRDGARYHILEDNGQYFYDERLFVTVVDDGPEFEPATEDDVFELLGIGG